MAIATETQWMRVNYKSDLKIGVDREAKVLRGMVVVMAGDVKDGRGTFDRKSLRSVVALSNAKPKGLKSRFTHPTLSSDGLGKYLGRVRDLRMDKMLKSLGDDKFEEIDIVRGDLFFDDSAFNTPSGDLATYVMDLAESDPDAISSSMVLQWDEEFRLKKDGTRELDENGNPLPPLLRPSVMHASDIVDQGAAVDGIFSIGGLPDEIVRQGSALLDQQFAGCDRATVKARAERWLSSYLELRFGPEEIEDDDPTPPLDEKGAHVDTLRRRMKLKMGA